MNGELGILNVGAGDTKLTFDKSKPEEVKRACAAVKDMIRRGFAILVQVGEKGGKPLYQRAEDFDADTAEYIIVGAPDAEETEEANQAAPATVRGGESGQPEKDVKLKKDGSVDRRGKHTRRIPAESTRAVGVARSAGG